MSSLVVPNELKRSMEHFIKLHNSRDYDTSHNGFYRMERLFFRPAIKNQVSFQNKLKHLMSLDSKNKITRWIKGEFRELAEHFGIQGLSVAYCKTNYSYYSSEKRKVFISDKFNKSSLSRDYASSLLVIIYHEFSHALDDEYYYGNGHGYSFFHACAKTIQYYFEVSKKSYWKKLKFNSRGASPKLSDAGFYGKRVSDLKEYSLFDGSVLPVSRKDMSEFKARDFASAVGILNSRYNCDLQYETVQHKRNDEPEYKTSPKFEYYNLKQTHLDLYESEPTLELEKHIPKYRFFFRRTGSEILVTVQKKFYLDILAPHELAVEHITHSFFYQSLREKGKL